jgi:hypothetical protein
MRDFPNFGFEPAVHRLADDFEHAAAKRSRTPVRPRNIALAGARSRRRALWPQAQWSGFDIRYLPSREFGVRMSNPKLHQHFILASGPLILTFAKHPCRTGMRMLESDH